MHVRLWEHKIECYVSFAVDFLHLRYYENMHICKNLLEKILEASKQICPFSKLIKAKYKDTSTTQADFND